MNLGTSYILWDYPSAVPYMWLQNTFVATLDPVATLGRLPAPGLSSASSQLLPRGWFPPGSCRLWFVLPLLCSPLAPSASPGLLSTGALGMWHGVGWHCPQWLGIPSCCSSRALGPWTPLEQQRKDPGNDPLQWAVVADVRLGKMLKFSV